MNLLLRTVNFLALQGILVTVVVLLLFLKAILKQKIAYWCVLQLWGTVNENRYRGPCVSALVYRPPKYNKDLFNNWVSEFLADIVSHCDRLLILGDFNIHLCYPSKPLVKEFLLLIDSMNLSQFVSSPSHNLGHTLDLVLPYGFPITNLRVMMLPFQTICQLCLNLSVFPSPLLALSL